MRAVFIASLGNPGSTYAHTLHSAGHTLLEALVSYTGFPSLRVSKQHTGTKGRYTYSDAQGVAFWESPDYMNNGGSGLATAWREWLSSQRANDDETGLEPRMIVVHDELELPCGKFSVKTGVGASARGHNGLKSFLGMPNMNKLQFTRIGVGIGPRPLSREPDQVAKYVLKKMTGEQKHKIEGIAAEVWKEIEKIQRGEEGAKKGGAQSVKQQSKRERKERGSSHPPPTREMAPGDPARASSI